MKTPNIILTAVVFAAGFLVTVSTSAIAREQSLQPVPKAPENPAVKWMNEALKKPVRLNNRNRDVLKKQKEWLKKFSKPTIGQGGSIHYEFSDSVYTVVTSPLRVTDIILEPGETITEGGVHIGDNIRWKISAAAHGTDTRSTTHLIVKPTVPDLRTTLLVFTNYRTYRFSLLSTKKDYMASVSFSYPKREEQALALELARIESRAKEREKKRQVFVPDANSAIVDMEKEIVSKKQKGSRINLDQLNFDYNLSGNKKTYWFPTRVFNDGVRTFIQLPMALSHIDAPVFYSVDSAGDKRLVNYRIKGRFIIIDRIFRKGFLLSDVGRKQERVTIEFTGAPYIPAIKAPIKEKKETKKNNVWPPGYFSDGVYDGGP